MTQHDKFCEENAKLHTMMLEFLQTYVASPHQLDAQQAMFRIREQARITEAYCTLPVPEHA